VFAVAGSDAQRSWVYERLRPYAGTHVVVGGCASYHAAVDHHLGALAASLGDTAAAEAHFRAALAMHERLGAAGWARLSKQALSGLLAAPAGRAASEVRLVNGVRLLCYEGKQVQLPDSKGLGDIAALIGAHGAGVHVLTLVGHRLARMGADPVLDETRVRDALAKIGQAHPELADHLRSSLRMGTLCSYSPAEPVTWKLS
jgi:hypothetical protein